MILYLDTSALVTLYVEEDESELVGGWVDGAEIVSTARIAYVECRAAFARAKREGILTATQVRSLVRTFDEDWARYTAIDVTESLVRSAGALAERRGLRGYDAVHLAAALELRGVAETLCFGCFDERLAKAAAAEGLLEP